MVKVKFPVKSADFIQHFIPPHSRIHSQCSDDHMDIRSIPCWSSINHLVCHILNGSSFGITFEYGFHFKCIFLVEYEFVVFCCTDGDCALVFVKNSLGGFHVIFLRVMTLLIGDLLLQVVLHCSIGLRIRTYSLI